MANGQQDPNGALTKESFIMGVFNLAMFLNNVT